MNKDDRRYWSDRAEAELGRARAALNPVASRAHYELAGLYLNYVHGGEPPLRPKLSLVTG